MLSLLQYYEVYLREEAIKAISISGDEQEIIAAPIPISQTVQESSESSAIQVVAADTRPSHQEKSPVETVEQCTIENQTNGNAPEAAEMATDIIGLFSANSIAYVDKRQQGGTLWIIGGMELAEFILKARKCGYYFKYCPAGGKSTGNRKSWYLASSGAVSHISSGVGVSGAFEPGIKPLEQNDPISASSMADEKDSASLNPSKEEHTISLPESSKEQERTDRTLPDEHAQGIVITTLEKTNNFAFCKPVYCTLGEYTLQNATSWQKVYLWLLNRLSEMNPRVFDGALLLAHMRQTHIRIPGYLDNGTAVETNLSATDLMRKVAAVARGCGVSPKGIIIGFMPPQAEGVAQQDISADTNTSRRFVTDDASEQTAKPSKALFEQTSAEQSPTITRSERSEPTQLLTAFERWLVTNKEKSASLGIIYRQALAAAARMLQRDDPNFSLLSERPEVIRTSFSKLKLSAGISRARISQFKKAIEYFAEFMENPDATRENHVIPPKVPSALPAVPSQEQIPESVEQRLIAFEKWMLETQGLSERTAYQYRSAMKVTFKYIQEAGLDVSLIDAGVEESRRIAALLLRRPDYSERNRIQNNRYRSALAHYIQFLQEDRGTDVATHVEVESTIDSPLPPESPRWAELVAQRFPRGWKPNYLTLQKFRMFWQATYGEELAESDEAITQRIMSSCIVYEGTAYAPECVLSKDAQMELYAYIDKAFDEGAVTISLSALYNALKELFSEERVYDSEMLKAYLRFAGREHCIVEGDHIVRERGARFDLSQALYEIYMEAGTPLSFAEIYRHFPHEDKRALIDRVKSDGRFVYDHMEDGWGFWFAVDLLDLGDEEIEIIADIIETEIADKQFMTSSELQTAIKESEPDLCERFAGFSWVGCREAIAKKLRGRYYFHGAIISRPGREMLAGDVFREYARKHAPLKVDQLWQLCGDMSSTMTIRWDSVFEVACRISETDVVPDAWLHFDVDAIDRVLGSLMEEDYLPLFSVSQFTMFPDCGVPWNHYVLEMYVYKYSRCYRLEHTGFAATGLAGIIVYRDSQIRSMDDVVLDLLRRKPTLRTKAVILDYLQDRGYIVRKRYENLDVLLEKAAIQGKEGQ